MINLKLEKSRKLSTEQICMIEDFAAQAANDGGFMNHFVFERAIFVFAAICLYPDKKEGLTALIGEGYDIRGAFDRIIKDGLAEEMYKTYQEDIDNLLSIGNTWFQDAAIYEHSARGLLDSINTLSGDIVQSAAEQLQKASEGEVGKILDFAEKWGANRVKGEKQAISKQEVDNVVENIKKNTEG